MKILCNTLVLGGAMKNGRVVGATLLVAPLSFEDQILLQFVQDNASEIKFQVGKYEWTYKNNKGE